MSRLPTLHPRRAAGLAGLLSAAALLVALKASTAPPPHKVALGAHTSSARSAPTAGGTAGRPPALRRNVLGAAVDVGYGTVQVRVHLSAGRIVDVTAVQLPAGGRSSDISAYAAPVLRREVLAAQSATIDVVSGASYTSDGYARSVQSALDAARQ
jgi:uncharacterized protein with FMN-binding domain